MTTEDRLRELAELHRDNALRVTQYLEHAQRVATLTLGYAAAVADEFFPGVREDRDLLVRIDMTKLHLTDLHRALQNVKDQADVTRVFACSNTLAIYIFGTRKPKSK